MDCEQLLCERLILSDRRRQIEQAEAALYRVAEGASGSNEADSFGMASKAALSLIETALAYVFFFFNDTATTDIYTS